ncbi:MAG: DUF1573 domain-containing protein [Chlorobi bacterium]|nr:DUF1573 domain-containing protein [Chlorobiota bacterium]
MKKLVYLIFAGTFIVSAVNAQEKNAPKPENKKAPVITFEETTHDYGTIEKGSDGTCEFVFTNTGKEPLVLSNVRSSCGCTVPSWPKEPLKKKKSSVIKVKYNTNRIGIISKTITVYSNAKNSPVRLKIVGKVVDKKTPKKNTGMPPFKPKEKTNTVPRNDNQ